MVIILALAALTATLPVNQVFADTVTCQDGYYGWFWSDGSGHCTSLGATKETNIQPQVVTTPNPNAGNTYVAPTVSSSSSTVTAGPSQGAFALASACNITLAEFKSYNGLSGPNPIIGVGTTYTCSPFGAPQQQYNTYNLPTAEGRSVAGGTGFTVTNEASWSDAAYKCADARTSGSDMQSLNYSSVGYLNNGDFVVCPLFNDASDGYVYAPTATVIPTGTQQSFWVEQIQKNVVLRTLIPITGGSALAFSYAATADVAAVLTVDGIVVGYLAIATPVTGFVIWQLASARSAINMDYVIAQANAQAQPQVVPTSVPDTLQPPMPNPNDPCGAAEILLSIHLGQMIPLGGGNQVLSVIGRADQTISNVDLSQILHVLESCGWGVRKMDDLPNGQTRWNVWRN